MHWFSSLLARNFLQVLNLGGHFLRDQFMSMLDSFLAECGVTKNQVTTTLKQALEEVVTQAHRQKNLERFFRVVFAQVGPAAQDPMAETRENYETYSYTQRPINMA